MKALYFKLAVGFGLASVFLEAGVLPTNQYAVWGIDDSSIVIPSGSVITEAVLTIAARGPADAPFYVHLLDNTKAGYETDIDTKGGDFFGPHGVLICLTYENGNYICRLSQNNDPQSPIRAAFPEPTSIRLGDSTTAVLSSALLELMDFVGNGKGFGIGIDPGDAANLNITNLTLDITIGSYLSAKSSTLTLSYDLPRPAGDINQDMRVDLNDVVVFSSNWLAGNCQSPGYCGGCDINESGTVDISDLSILIQNWLQ